MRVHTSKCAHAEMNENQSVWDFPGDTWSCEVPRQLWCDYAKMLDLRVFCAKFHVCAHNSLQSYATLRSQCLHNSVIIWVQSISWVVIGVGRGTVVANNLGLSARLKNDLFSLASCSNSLVEVWKISEEWEVSMYADTPMLLKGGGEKKILTCLAQSSVFSRQRSASSVWPITIDDQLLSYGYVSAEPRISRVIDKARWRR